MMILEIRTEENCIIIEIDMQGNRCNVCLEFGRGVAAMNLSAAVNHV